VLDRLLLSMMDCSLLLLVLSMLLSRSLIRRMD
jgi:hypothetical protein